MPISSSPDPRKVLLQAAAILLLSLSLTLVAWLGVRDQVERLVEARFSTVAKDVAVEIDKRMQDYEQILRGGVALLEASSDVTRDEWRRYIERLRVDEHYPGIQGIGVAVHVPAELLPLHQENIRREGYSDYAVTPPGSRDDYFPIVFLEPFAGRNLRAFGYDMFSDPVRGAAMARARDAGSPAMSGKVRLVQETGVDEQSGVLLYLPVYDRAADVSTVEARRNAVLGFVYSPFRMADLMTGILGSDERVSVDVYDGEQSPAALLFSTARPAVSEYRRLYRLDMFGRIWLVEVAATPGLAAELRSSAPALVLGAGLIISVLLMWLATSMVSERLKRLALAKANADLAAARREAEAANRAKSRFLAAASHDIRQPVQSLVLLVAALARQLDGHPSQPLLRHLDTSLEALRMLLSSLLDVSKLDAGVIEPEIRRIDLRPLLEGLADEYRLRAEDKGLRLTVTTCEVEVATDPTLLERILRNLLENALRYTPDGEVGLICHVQGKTARVEIRDTGIGIPPEHLNRVFEEFHQVGNSERDRSQGLGLGLAIVRRLAEMLGHRIEVTSSLGKGSCFTVTLDSTERASQAA